MRLLLGLLVLSAWSATPGFAQDVRLTAVAGFSDFDLSGTGTALTVGARADVPLRPMLLLEGSVGTMIVNQQFDTTTVLLPEAQIQVQLPRRLAPYLGLGIGVAIDFREEDVGGTQVDPTFSGAAGVRFDVTDELGLRAELRVRGHETGFVGTTADVTGGVSWRF